MSLYDKASLALIPSGYKTGTTDNLYSVLPANGNGDFNATRGSSATRVNKDGLIESVVANTPRLNYPLIDGVVQSCPELLLEPTATNEITYSEDISNGWTNTETTETLDSSAVAPDGSAGVYKIAPTATTNNHSIQLLNLDLDGSTVVFSVFAKAGTERYVRLRLGNTTDNPRVWYDLEKGIVEKQDIVGMGGIEDYGNGWYRLIVANTGNTITSTTGVAQIFIQSESSIDKATPQTTFTGDPNQYIYVWGAQWENTEHVSSYIPTSGSTVTRSADACNSAGTSAEFNDSEGVFFAEIASLGAGSVRRFAIDNNTSPINIVRLEYSSTTNRVFGVIYNGSSQIALSFYVPNELEFNKVAFKYKSGDFALWVNGVEVDASTSTFTMPTGLKTLGFDDGSGGNKFYSKTKQVMVFNEALTDSELEQVTSWTSFGEMAKGQLYTIE